MLAFWKRIYNLENIRATTAQKKQTNKNKMITVSICTSDQRTAFIYNKGLRVALVVFVVNGPIPANLRAQLLNGFKSLKQAKTFCAGAGLAWFNLAQG